MMKEVGEVLTIIPAKGLSTRLKRKNLADLAGKPLLAYAIDTAKKSGVCGEIMVSTEDPEIAACARSFGADVPFLRPEHLCHDPYEVPDVCLNVLDQYEAMGRVFDTLLITLPTCPFCEPRDVQAAVRMYCEKDASFVMTVSKMEPHYYHAMILDADDGQLNPVFDDDTMYGRRKRPHPVHCNGAVHVVDVAAYCEARTYYGTPLYGLEMPVARSVDIDTEDDLAYARWLINRRGAGTDSDEGGDVHA